MVWKRTELSALTLTMAAASLLWGVGVGQPIWVAVIIIVMAAVAWSLRRSEVPRPSSRWTILVPVLAVPLLATVFPDRGTIDLMVNVVGPELLFFSCLYLLAAGHGQDDLVRTKMMLILSFLASLSAGVLALLSLYYIDAFLDTSLITTNAQFMWSILAFTVVGALLSLILGYDDTAPMILDQAEGSD